MDLEDEGYLVQESILVRPNELIRPPLVVGSGAPLPQPANNPLLSSQSAPVVSESDTSPSSPVALPVESDTVARHLYRRSGGDERRMYGLLTTNFTMWVPRRFENGPRFYNVGPEFLSRHDYTLVTSRYRQHTSKPSAMPLPSSGTLRWVKNLSLFDTMVCGFLSTVVPSAMQVYYEQVGICHQERRTRLCEALQGQTGHP
jgi:hypothetical protein